MTSSLPSPRADRPQTERPLIVVCDWIPPAFGAVGQYELSRAETAAKFGRSVTLIGLGESAGEHRRMVGAGQLHVVRLLAEQPEKNDFAKRACWALAQNLSLLLAVAHHASRHPSEIKVTGSPPFLSYAVLMWRWFNRQHTVTYRVTDFYPETAFAARKALALRPTTPIFHALRRQADRVEALSDCQLRRLAASGVLRARIEVVRDESPISFSSPQTPAHHPFSPDEVVLLYSGNLGIAHDWRTFAEAYRRQITKERSRIRLWLNATGVAVQDLVAYCRTHDLPVHLTPPTPLSSLAGVLLAADAHLILLGDEFWGYVFPSKTYACLESGKPCLYVGPEESDVHALLSADAAHISVRQNQVDAASEALERLVRRATVGRSSNFFGQ